MSVATATVRYAGWRGSLSEESPFSPMTHNRCIDSRARNITVRHVAVSLDGAVSLFCKQGFGCLRRPDRCRRGIVPKRGIVPIKVGGRLIGRQQSCRLLPKTKHELTGGFGPC